MKTSLDINQRWEKGDEHHPKSAELYKLIAAIDFKYQSDCFGFVSGGDGDNGENLMYLLDIIFDAEDNGETEVLKKKLGVK